MADPSFPRRRRDRRHSFPLIPLLAACLIVVVALQGVKLAFDFGLFDRNISTPSFLQGKGESATASRPSAFENIGRMQALRRQAGDFTPVRLSAPAFSHNLQLGNAQARHTLTIFTDPACGRCRSQLQKWLETTPSGAFRLVYKYWPADAAAIDGGLVLELARRQNVARDLLQQLSTTQGNLAAADMFRALESIGLPLARQRTLLAEQASDLTQLLGKDIDQGRNLKLGPPPQILLDDYLIDGQVLLPTRLGLYMGRLTRRQALVQPDDYWLNSGN